MNKARRRLLGFAALASLPVGQARAAASVMREPSGSDRSLTIETTPEPPQSSMREGHAVSGSAKLWWWDTGGFGPAIVLLHPATGSGRVWRYQQQAFVDAGLRVVGYSRRGAAGSTAGDPDDRTSMVDDLRAVAAEVGLDRFHLLGTAAGAFTALAFARTSPERLLGLVLANSLLGVTGGEVDRMVRDVRLAELQRLPADVRELGPAYRVANPAGTARWAEYSRESQDAAGKRPDGSVDASASGASSPRSGLTLEDLRLIRLPVLLIAGDADLLAPPPLMEVFARYLPDCRMTRFPACGHSGYWEMPTLFNETVISFIKARGTR